MSQSAKFSAPMRLLAFGAGAALSAWAFASVAAADRLSLAARINRVSGPVEAVRGTDDVQFTILLVIIGGVGVACLALCLSAAWDLMAGRGKRP